MDFGCFVELVGFRQRAEGLVHLSNISSTKRGGSAKDLVNKGEREQGRERGLPHAPAAAAAVAVVAEGAGGSAHVLACTHARAPGGWDAYLGACGCC